MVVTALFLTGILLSIATMSGTFGQRMGTFIMGGIGDWLDLTPSSD